MNPTLNSNTYVFEERIGSGTWGEVWLSRDTQNNKIAIKKLPKKKVTQKSYLKEITAMKKLKGCDGAVRFYDSWEDDKFYYLVFDFVSGKDLLVLLTEAKFEPLTENDAKKVLLQLVDTLMRVHKRRVVHNDLKLENVLVDPITWKTTLIDFGLSEVVPENTDVCTGDAGSFEYLGPEKIMPTNFRSYSGFKADVWSLGTVLYAILFAQFPWSKAERKQHIQTENVHPKLKFPKSRFISEEGKDLIQKMLNEDIHKRMDLKSVRNHPWFSTEKMTPSQTKSLLHSSSTGNY
jgi:serine/threonine protein kinase